MKIRHVPPGDLLEVLDGGEIRLKSGATLTAEAGSVLAFGDALEGPGDIALAHTHVLVGDATGKAADVAMSGDVTINDAGATAIAAGAITSAKLANGAGIAALLTAGLGNARSYIKTKNDTTDLLAANATKARAVLIVVTVDETLAAGDTTAPTFSVGEESGAADKFVTAASLATKVAGTVQVYAGTNTANKKIQVTGTTKVGTGTGGITVTVIAIPTT